MEKCDCCCVIRKKCKPPKINYQKQVDCCKPRYQTILGAMRRDEGNKQKCCGELGADEVHIKKQKCSISAQDRKGVKLTVALSCDKFNTQEDPCGSPRKPACCGPKPCTEPTGQGKQCCPPAPCCGSDGGKQPRIKARQCPGAKPVGNGDQCKQNKGREYFVCVPKCPKDVQAQPRDCGPPCWPDESNEGDCSRGDQQAEDMIGKKLVICMPCNDDVSPGNVKVYVPSGNAPQKQPTRVKDYMYRCESRELIGSKLLSYCECVKRNGLQDRCPRTPCQGRPACLVKPWPDCWPSGGCYGQDYERPKGFERANPTLQYRRDNKICPSKDASPDVKVIVQHC